MPNSGDYVIGDRVTHAGHAYVCTGTDRTERDLANRVLEVIRTRLVPAWVAGGPDVTRDIVNIAGDLVDMMHTASTCEPPSSVEASDEDKRANAAAFAPPTMASLSRW